MRGKILIVEDFADWRDLLQGVLQREGHQVEAVSTLQAARDQIQKTKDLDLAILDIRLVETDESNEDGMRLLAQIQGRKDFTRVIMITGHGDVPMAVEAMHVGAFDFLEKPFNPDKMTELAKKAANARRLTLDNRALRKELSDGTGIMKKLGEVESEPGHRGIDLVISDIRMPGFTGMQVLERAGRRHVRHFHVRHVFR